VIFSFMITGIKDIKVFFNNLGSFQLEVPNFNGIWVLSMMIYEKTTTLNNSCTSAGTPFY
jgi:hypothetical protein